MKGLSKMRRLLKISAAVINTIIIFLLAAVLYLNKKLPDNYYVVSGGALKLNSFVEAIPCVVGGDTVDTAEFPDGKADLKLLGLIPIKTVSVQEIDTPLVVPSGAPFGIKLLTDGVIVVEVSSFETDSGFKCPAKECGIKAGDIIKSIDGKTVNSNSEVEKIISSGG